MDKQLERLEAEYLKYRKDKEYYAEKASVVYSEIKALRKELSDKEKEESIARVRYNFKEKEDKYKKLNDFIQDNMDSIDLYKLMNNICKHTLFIDRDNAALVKVINDLLPINEACILISTQAKEMTYKRAGEIVGLSGCRISGIRSGAIKKLAHPETARMIIERVTKPSSAQVL